MRRGVRKHTVRAVSVLAVLLALASASAAHAAAPPPPTVPALQTPFLGTSVGAPVPPGTKMIVESTELVYDYDKKTVAAVGNVHIYYGQYTLLANQVTYYQDTQRLIADGNVRLTDPNGNVYRSTHVDVTSNFANAFIQSLEVDTADQTHFFAASATRQSGQAVTFIDGSYTACEVCEEHPEKPPFWNVKATKIVVDQQEHTIAFSDAELQFFGRPVAYFPYFSIPDPTVTRKTGFLWPTGSYSNHLGVGLTVPYFWDVSPSSDLTVAPAYYTKQGLLGDVQWQQATPNGQYSIEAAGIDQQDKAAFSPTSSSYRDLRGGVHTLGDFAINANWSYGWDATLLSDRTFTRDYKLLSGDNSEIVSNVHLTGLGDRDYFNASASAYQVLTEPSAAPPGNPGKYDQGRQGVAAPVVDYDRVSDWSPFGGELTQTANLTTIERQKDDPFQADGDPAPDHTYYFGTAGTTVRATDQVGWQRQDIMNSGEVVTPFASLRGDAWFLDQNTAAPTVTGASTAFRAMPSIGVETSYPLLISSSGATQIIEPKAQLIVRPDEMGIGRLPNDDADSLVYEVSNLFDRDKFSGFDRDEGGSRLNLGLHYNGSFANGAVVDSTFGQSFQLFGLNSYAVTDVADVGPDSGLATAQSDYVGDLSFNTGAGPTVDFRGRFDNKTFAVNQAEIEATAALGPVTASATYFYLRNDPNNDVAPGPASVVHTAASVNLSDTWRAFGSVAYDVANSALAGDSLGVAFDNSCLTLSVTYDETRKNYTDLEPDRSINFRLELRTLGTAAVSGSLNALQSG